MIREPDKLPNEKKIDLRPPFDNFCIRKFVILQYAMR
jgi:hypothetical protein